MTDKPKVISELTLQEIEARLAGIVLDPTKAMIRELIHSYREAIKVIGFYNDRQNWIDTVRRWGTGQGQYEVSVAPAKEDQGKKARQFLGKE